MGDFGFEDACHWYTDRDIEYVLLVSSTSRRGELEGGGLTLNILRTGA